MSPEKQIASVNKTRVSFCETPIGFLDWTILITMWLTVFAASIWRMGRLPACLFVILNLILVIRNSGNGILVFLLICYTPAVTLDIPFGPFTVSAGIMLFVYIFKDLLGGRQRPAFNPFLLCTGLFVAYLSITVVYAPDQKMGILYFVKYVEGLVVLVLFFLTVRTKEDLGRVLKWWALVAGLAFAVKVIHYYLGANTELFRVFKMMEAFDFERAYELKRKLSFNIKGSVVRRFLLPGEEPNYVSAGLIFPFSIALALYNVSKLKYKMFWCIFACMIAVTTIGTYSRSGFLAILIVLVLYLFRNHLRAAIPALLLTATFFLLVTRIPELHERIFGIGGAIERGATHRFDLWSTAIEMWIQSPILGNGLASYYYKVHTATHNTYLQFLAETGLIGLTLFLVLIVIPFRSVLKMRSVSADKKNKDILFSQVILAGLLGVSFMIATITYQDIKLFWLSCGTCVAMYYISKRELFLERTRKAVLSPDGDSHG